MRKTKIQLLLYITISHMSRSEIGNWLEVLKNGTKKMSCKSATNYISSYLHNSLTPDSVGFEFPPVWKPWASLWGEVGHLSPLSEIMWRQHLLWLSHVLKCVTERGSRVGIAWSKTAFDMVFAFALLFLSFLLLSLCERLLSSVFSNWILLTLRRGSRLPL